MKYATSPPNFWFLVALLPIYSLNDREYSDLEWRSGDLTENDPRGARSGSRSRENCPGNTAISFSVAPNDNLMSSQRKRWSALPVVPQRLADGFQNRAGASDHPYSATVMDLRVTGVVLPADWEDPRHPMFSRKLNRRPRALTPQRIRCKIACDIALE